MSLSVHPIRGDRILTYFIVGNINLDYEVKVVLGFSTVQL